MKNFSSYTFPLIVSFTEVSLGSCREPPCMLTVMGILVLILGLAKSQCTLTVDVPVTSLCLCTVRVMRRVFYHVL